MKKSLSLVLSALLLHAVGLAPAAADTPLERSRASLLASRVKAGVAHLGADKRAVVRVVLHDKTEYHGRVTHVGDDSFVVADAKTGATAPIEYRVVNGIKGHNFSTGAKIGIGIAVAGTIAIIAAALTRGGDDDEVDQTVCAVPTVTTPCPANCVCFIP